MMKTPKPAARQNNEPFSIPRAIREGCDDYAIHGPARVAILPDIHIPFHDEEALEIAFRHVSEFGPTHILFNGDLGDFYQCSDFEKDPKLRPKLGESLEMIEAFLAEVRRSYPGAKIVYKCGNHDDRIRRYIWNKAPELASVPTCTIQEFLNLDDYEIKWVPDYALVRVGKLIVLHGHEYRTKYSGGLTNPATTLFRKAKCLVLCSHHHQSNRHSEKTADGKILTAWTTGCLCQLNPKWNSRNNWTSGFATVVVQPGGAFDVQNYRIIDGRLYA